MLIRKFEPSGWGHTVDVNENIYTKPRPRRCEANHCSCNRFHVWSVTGVYCCGSLSTIFAQLWQNRMQFFASLGPKSRKLKRRSPRAAAEMWLRGLGGATPVNVWAQPAPSEHQQKESRAILFTGSVCPFDENSSWFPSLQCTLAATRVTGERGDRIMQIR